MATVQNDFVRVLAQFFENYKPPPGVRKKFAEAVVEYSTGPIYSVFSFCCCLTFKRQIFNIVVA
jgi:hypothetical protein